MKTILTIFAAALATEAVAGVRAPAEVARLTRGASAIYPLAGPKAGEVAEQVKASAASLAAETPSLTPADPFVLPPSCPKREARCIAHLAQAKKINVVFVGGTRSAGGKAVLLTLVAVFPDGTASAPKKARVDPSGGDQEPLGKLLSSLTSQLPRGAAPPATAAASEQPAPAPATIAASEPAAAPAVESAPAPQAAAPAPAPAVTPPPEAAPQPEAPSSAGAPSASSETAPAPESALGFRWGVNGQGGYFISAKAVDFGAAGRAGVQLSDMLGVYADLGYTAGIGLGGSVSSSGASVSVSGVGYWHVGAMAELDLGVFFLAAGPFISSGGWGQVSEGGSSSGGASQYVVVAGGWMPGLEAHMGFTFGRAKPNGRRSGFTLAVDFKMMNASLTSVQQTAGPSGASQSFKVGDRIWGMTPMLMLGYDYR